MSVSRLTVICLFQTAVDAVFRLIPAEPQQPIRRINKNYVILMY